MEPYVPGEQPRLGPGQRLIKLNTNENPYPPSPGTLRAIAEAAQADLRKYPDPASEELRQALARQYGCTKAEVFVGNGSDEVLALAFGAFFATNEVGACNEVGATNFVGAKALLFPDITYSFYPVYANFWQIPYQKIPLDTKLAIVPTDYLRPCGGIIFPNPNAPTSLALDREEIIKILRYQQAQGNVVVVDEAYIDFGGQSLVRDIHDFDNLLVVHTFSKSRSLAGLRVGYALGNRELIDGLTRVKDSFNSYPLDRLAQTGALAALEDQAYYDRVNAQVIASRKRLAKNLADLGFSLPPPSGNFIFARHKDIDAEELFVALRQENILVRHFKAERIANYLRISIGLEQEMDELVACLRRIIQEKIDETARGS